MNDRYLYFFYLPTIPGTSYEKKEAVRQALAPSNLLVCKKARYMIVRVSFLSTDVYEFCF